MNTGSRFNKSAARAASVGAKATNDVRAQFTFERQKNRLTLNAMASKELRAQAGMYIKVFINDAPDATVNDRFAIAVFNEEVAGAAKISQTGTDSVVGRPCYFNYSGVWSMGYQNTDDATEVGTEVLKEAGLMKEYHTTTRKDGSKIYTLLGTKKVSFGIEKIEDAGEIGGVAYEALYALVNVEETELGDPSLADAVANGEAVEDAPKTKAPKAIL